MQALEREQSAAYNMFKTIKGSQLRSMHTVLHVGSWTTFKRTLSSDYLLIISGQGKQILGASPPLPYKPVKGNSQ
jgi:hypothetical protein